MTGRRIDCRRDRLDSDASMARTKSGREKVVRTTLHIVRSSMHGEYADTRLYAT